MIILYLLAAYFKIYIYSFLCLQLLLALLKIFHWPLSLKHWKFPGL